MLRLSFRTEEEILDHHRCVTRGAISTCRALTNIEPYQTVAMHVVSPEKDLPEIRTAFEIEEIYVRPPLENAVYEPLASRHFTISGRWFVIARKRHPSNNVRVVGLMLAKDEDDVIPDVISSLSVSLDALYYFAGDEATKLAIERASRPGWARAVVIPDVPHSDGLRQYLLEAARQDRITDNDPRPMWVVSAQGDEIYHDDLRLHLMLAQVDRATLLTCQVATFVLHESQKEGTDWTLPLEKRLTHYVWDFGEHAAHLDFPWTYWNPHEHMRAHPHGVYPSLWAKARPVRKHYPFRSPEQAKKRIEDRLKSGWQPHYENYKDVFVGREAAGREVKKFHGWFPEAERVGEGIW